MPISFILYPFYLFFFNITGCINEKLASSVLLNYLLYFVTIFLSQKKISDENPTVFILSNRENVSHFLVCMCELYSMYTLKNIYAQSFPKLLQSIRNIYVVQQYTVLQSKTGFRQVLVTVSVHYNTHRIFYFGSHVLLGLFFYIQYKYLKYSRHCIHIHIQLYIHNRNNC